MTINRKYNAEERAEITRAIAIRAIANSTEQAPKTQEEFDEWAEKIVKEYYENKAKEETRQQKRTEKENQPGVKAKRNFKRYETEIQKAEKEIKRLQKQIQYYEQKKKEAAEIYEAETNEKIK